MSDFRQGEDLGYRIVANKDIISNKDAKTLKVTDEEQLSYLMNLVKLREKIEIFGVEVDFDPDTESIHNVKKRCHDQEFLLTLNEKIKREFLKVRENIMKSIK